MNIPINIPIRCVPTRYRVCKIDGKKCNGKRNTKYGRRKSVLKRRIESIWRDSFIVFGSYINVLWF